MKGLALARPNILRQTVLRCWLLLEEAVFPDNHNTEQEAKLSLG